MPSFQRWFRRTSNDAVQIGHSQVRLNAIDSALFMIRFDDPTMEALVFFHPPHPNMRRICAKYRGSEAEDVRLLLRSLARS